MGSGGVVAVAFWPRRAEVELCDGDMYVGYRTEKV